MPGNNFTAVPPFSRSKKARTLNSSPVHLLEILFKFLVQALHLFKLSIYYDRTDKDPFFVQTNLLLAQNDGIYLEPGSDLWPRHACAGWPGIARYAASQAA